jgi:hypothetical protein
VWSENRFGNLNQVSAEVQVMDSTEVQLAYTLAAMKADQGWENQVG